MAAAVRSAASATRGTVNSSAYDFGYSRNVRGSFAKKTAGLEWLLRSTGGAAHTSSIVQRNRTPLAEVSSRTVTKLQADLSMSGKCSSPMQMTFLEINGFLLDILGLKILVDPVLVGNLDFGVPWLFKGFKRKLANFTPEDLPELDFLLICQSLEDHCHEATLSRLSRLNPDLHVIATPNAKPKLSKLFKNATFLEPGESIFVKGRNGISMKVRATAGPVVGLPWQRPENGYFMEVTESNFTVYYEPHCVFKNANLEQEHADVIVTPVIKQIFQGYPLVFGQEDAVKLVELLNPKYVVLMMNGDFDFKGIIASLVYEIGTVQNFLELLSKVAPNVVVLNPEPGIPLDLPVELETSIPLPAKQVVVS